MLTSFLSFTILSSLSPLLLDQPLIIIFFSEMQELIIKSGYVSHETTSQNNRDEDYQNYPRQDQYETKSAVRTSGKELSKIQDIADWVDVRRKCWADHIERMSENRLPKIVRDNRPQGTRSNGRPKKDGINRLIYKLEERAKASIKKKKSLLCYIGTDGCSGDESS